MYINKLNKYNSKLNDLIGGKRLRADQTKMNEKISIGAGTYGCIISPPLKCRGDAPKPKQPHLRGLNPEEDLQKKDDFINELHEYKNKYTNLVSKLMNANNAEQEFAETRILQPIDPENKYFLYPVKICDVEPNNIKLPDGSNIDAVDECLSDNPNIFEGQNPQDGKLLYSNYAGNQIVKLNVKYNDIKNVFLGLENLLVGLNVLHTNNLVHMDIKYNNVLSLKKENNFISRFIDFGIMINIPQYFARIFAKMPNGGYIYPDIYGANYYIWPLDIKFISRDMMEKRYNNIYQITTKMNESIGRDKLQFRRNLLSPNNIEISNTLFYYEDDITDGYGRRRTPNSSIINNDDTFENLMRNIRSFFITEPIIEWKRNLPEDLSTVVLNPGTPQFDLYSKLLKGVDIYSIGILFSQIYSKYIGQIAVDVPDPVSGKDYKFFDYRLWDTELPPDLIDYLDRLYTELTLPFNTFCKHCMDFNFMRRINIATALAEFNTLKPRFDILNEPEFQRLCAYRRMP
jgi:serine/threonine protein kinase